MKHIWRTFVSNFWSSQTFKTVIDYWKCNCVWNEFSKTVVTDAPLGVRKQSRQPKKKACKCLTVTPATQKWAFWQRGKRSSCLLCLLGIRKCSSEELGEGGDERQQTIELEDLLGRNQPGTTLLVPFLPLCVGIALLSSTQWKGNTL